MKIRSAYQGPYGHFTAASVNNLQESGAQFINSMFYRLEHALADLSSMKSILERVEIYMLALTALIYFLTLLGALGMCCKFCWEKHQKAHIRAEYQRQSLLGRQSMRPMLNSTQHTRRPSNLSMNHQIGIRPDDRMYNLNPHVPNLSHHPNTGYTVLSPEVNTTTDQMITPPRQSSDNVPRIAIQQASFEIDDQLLDFDKSYRHSDTVKASGSDPEIAAHNKIVAPGIHKNSIGSTGRGGDEMV